MAMPETDTWNASNSFGGSSTLVGDGSLPPDLSDLTTREVTA